VNCLIRGRSPEHHDGAPRVHEYPPARIQDKAKLAPILQGSLEFVKAIDEAAVAMYSLHEVMKSQGVKVQGVGREAYRS
jgi:hypothetical protein